MAKQKGAIKLEGSIGDISFYKSQDGFLARTRTGISKQRMATDPRFERTRENASEFGRAGSMGKILLTAVKPALKNVSDSRMFSRLVKSMIKIIQSDRMSSRGNRVIQPVNLGMLVGFDFNDNAKISSTIFFNLLPVRKTDDNDFEIGVPAFVPMDSIKAPSGTTHFRITLAFAKVSFFGGLNSVEVKPGEIMEYNSRMTEEYFEKVLKPTEESKHIYTLLGIEFLQQVNNNYYSLRNGTHNSMTIHSFEEFDEYAFD